MKENKITPGTIILWIYSLLSVFVFLYLCFTSLRSRDDILSNIAGIPQSISFSNYVALFTKDRFHLYIANSLLILVFSLTITIVLSAMVAYGIGNFRFKFRNVLVLFFLAGLMFPIELGVVPIFSMMKGLGMLDSQWSVILIYSAGMSMAVFLLTVFFERMPRVIYESAKIDGASEWKTFYKIMFPMASPVVFSMSIISSLRVWNQFFVPMIFLQSENKKTIPLALAKYKANFLFTIDSALAGSVIASVPLLILFFIFADKIVDGVMDGAVKE